MKPHERPIGYWLKLVDRRIEAAFERILAEDGLQRRHWQTLRLLEAAPHHETEVAAALAPFLDASDPDAVPALHELVDRGWVRVEAGQYSLTRDGAAANVRLAKRVGALRVQTTEGITQHDYAAALAILARIADNLQDATDISSQPEAARAR